jgi:peptide/nickel transport system substrate-binding protein
MDMGIKRWSYIKVLMSGIILLCIIAVGCGGDSAEAPEPTAMESSAATDVPATAPSTSVPATSAVEPSTPVVATRAPESTAADVGETKDAGYLTPPEADARYGGVLRWGGIANSTLYDLHQTGSIANMGPQAPMFDLLVQVDPVNWDSIIADIATSWIVSDDGLTYTFTIREGVKFHDGAPLTAEDVAASFDQIVFPPAGVLSPRQGLFDAVTEIVAVDAGTVEFRLRERRPFLLSAIKGGFNVIVRKETLEANGYDLRRVPTYPGTGPFVTDSLEPGVVRKLTRNDGYWNPELPYLDGIEAYHFDLGPKTGAACLANNLDFCFGIDPISEERAAASNIVTARIFPTVPLGLWMNSNTKPFDDVRVRQAVNLVLDKPALVEAVYEVFPTVPSGWLMPTDPLFEDYWAEVKDLPGWRTPTEEDRAEARRLMEEAGYADGIDDLVLIVRQTISFFEAWSPIVQDVLARELNINSELKPVASGAWYEEVKNGNYDLSITGFGVTLPHVADYWSNAFRTDGGYNFIPYSNPEFDGIVAATQMEADPVKFQQLIDDGIELLDREVPMIVFGSLFVIDAWYDYVHPGGAATKGANYWEGMRNEIWWMEER